MSHDFPLGDTYRAYKEATHSAIAWLAETARCSGCADRVFGGRKKGKARHAPHQMINIRVAHLTDLAKAVVRSATAVPERVLLNLKAAIDARKDCAEWYDSRGLDDVNVTGTTTGGHRHFILVLEVVLKQLSSLEVTKEWKQPKVKSMPAARLNVPAKQTTSLQNRFALLEVQQPSNDSQSSVPKSNPATSSGTKEITYIIESDEEERSFAVYCMMREIEPILLATSHTWHQYREHQIALTTAAATTNAAISMFRSVNLELIADFHDLRDHGEVIASLRKDSSGRVARFESEREEFDCEIHGRTKNPRMDSDEGALSASYKDLMKGLLGCWKNGGVPPRISTKPCCDTESCRRKFERWQCFYLMGHYTKRPRDGSAPVIEDAMIYAVDEMLSMKPVASWHVLAWELFTIIHNHMKEDVERGFQDLRQASILIDQSLTQYKELMSILSLDDDRPTQNDLLLNTGSSLRTLSNSNTDVIQELVDLSETSPLEDGGWGAFHLLKMSPLLCGTNLVHAQAVLHYFASTIMAQSCHVMTAIHLYNAAAQSGIILGLHWLDLEMLIKFQSEKLVFLGARPISALDCHRRNLLSKGYSIVNFAPQRRTGADLYSKSGVRKLQIMSVLASTLCENMRNHDANGLTGPSEYSILAEEIIKNTRILYKDDDRVKPRESQNNTEDPVIATKAFTLKQILQRDEAKLYLDLLSLQVRVATLLAEIQRYCCETYPKSYPSLAFSGTNGGIFVVNRMLAYASTDGFDRAPGFKHACHLIETLVQTEGHVETMTVQRFLEPCTRTGCKCEDDHDDCDVSEEKAADAHGASSCGHSHGGKSEAKDTMCRLKRTM